MKERKNQGTSPQNQNNSESELQKAARKAAEEELRAAQRVSAEKARIAAKIEREKERAERKKERSQKHCKGFGAWLTATVFLSAAVLALSAVLTVGYYDLAAYEQSAAGGYRALTLELSEQVESLDTDFAKARVFAEGSLPRAMLTDALVHCRLAEQTLEKLPTDSHASERISEFFNRTGDCAQRILAHGSAKESDLRQMESFCLTLEKMREKMPALIESAHCMKSGAMGCSDGDFYRAFEELSLCVEEYERAAEPSADTSFVRSMPTIDAAAAEQKVRELFEEYSLAEVKTTGETAGELPCYTVEFSDAEGRAYSAYITVQGGLLAMFESDFPCQTENFTSDECVEIARAFLVRCGLDSMSAVWQSEADLGCCVTFVPERKGELLYSERVTVKVCCERGVVTGADLTRYLCNRQEYPTTAATVSAERAQRIAGLEDVQSVRLARIRSGGEERLTYEVHGMFGGREYFVYVDARTGEPLEARVVTETDRGRVLR